MSGSFRIALNETLFGEMTVLFQMFGAGVVFFAIATAAALYGFGVVSDETPLAAKLCSVFFLLLAVATFGWAWMNRSRQAGRPGHRKSHGRVSDQAGALAAGPTNPQSDWGPYNSSGVLPLSQGSHPLASWAC
jgi:hypothetical protein